MEMEYKWEDLNTEEYYNFISKIISERGQWSDEVRYSDRGCERHHIMLACKGGAPKSIGWTHHKNIIWLYPSEHFEIHKILAEANSFDIQVVLAWSMMIPKRDIYITPEEYENLRKLRDNIKLSDSTKSKISKSLMGHKVSNDTKEKIKLKRANQIMPRWTNERREHMIKLQSKKVRCIELDIIFDSLKLAGSWLINTTGHGGDICSVCKGNKKTAGGYHWEYVINNK